MTESEQGSQTIAPPGDQKHPAQSLREVLAAFVGRVAVISNPESLRSTPLGHQIGPHVHKARITSVRDDIVSVMTKPEKGDNGDRFPPRQFIPLHWIKLVCVAKDEVHIHI